MASHINFSDSALRAREARLAELAIAEAREAAKAQGSKWARFWRWMNTPLWGKK